MKAVGGGKEDDIYRKRTKNHHSNFISVAPLPRPTYLFHGEFFGMIYESAHRIKGVKNPVKSDSDLIAYFSFCNSGIKIEYLTPADELVVFKNPLALKSASFKNI